MLGPREGGRQSEDDTNRKEKFRIVIRQAKGRAFRMHCNIIRMNGPSLTYYGPLSATPKSTGRSAGVLQRQPLSVFWNANAFSIRSFRAIAKPSLVTHDGFASPSFTSQHMPVQLDAIGLQSPNGESTIISTSAVAEK
jgi:hypothetical protein